MKTHFLSAIFLFTLATFSPAAPTDIPRNEAEKPGDTLLHDMAKYLEPGREDIQKILEMGVDINAKNARGETALHLAKPGTAEQLLLLGADADLPNDEGETPLHGARPEKGRILVAYGADVNARDNDGDTPLHACCLPGRADAAYVRLLLDRGADVNAKSVDHYTPLMACMMSWGSNPPDEQTVRLLIERGADVNARMLPSDEAPSIHPHKIFRKDYLHQTPVHHVIRWLPQLFPLCVDNGADLNMTNTIGETFMHYAATSDLAVLDFLVGHCGNIHAQDNFSRTPLHAAAQNANLENVRRLVAMGADIHAKNVLGQTPVFSVVGTDDGLVVVQFLHAHGADLRATDLAGNTMLHYAATGDVSRAFVAFLVEHGLDIDAKNHAGNTPLHTAADKWRVKSLDLLAELGADVNAKNAEGLTPLHLAADLHDPTDVMRCLLGHGADASAADIAGRTPMHMLIVHYSKASLAEMLLDAGADLHVRDNEGRTLLHYVADGYANTRRRAWLDYLLFAELDINAQDNAGNTPLHIAAEKYPDMARTLLECGADASIHNNAGELPEIENEERSAENE